jgi:hypothetical protein
MSEPKERPILFSGPMVNAILEDRKTHTRRILNDKTDGCPYGIPGDRLWVREAFCADFKPLIYRATATSDTYGGEKIKYKPSIHMPRRYSRITLEITGLKVEKLQNISEADAQAEGVEFPAPYSGVNGKTHPTCIDAFQVLWTSINGPDSWSQNPYVWVIQFKRIAQPS